MNESQVDVKLVFEDNSVIVPAGMKTEIIRPRAKHWTAEKPILYTLEIYANGEKIEESIGFREVTIDGKVFKINGDPVKLKGVNRHDFNCETAATVSLADYVQNFPRFGFEFGVDKGHCNFSYVGFGPTESYADKLAACEYGYYVSSAEENYDMKYIRPQESGSHYACKYMAVKDLFKVTAEKPFSCSVNPYTTEQLRETLHSFELEENDFVNVCVDVAIRGVGSHSCGPALPEEYEIPREGSNTFKFTF